MTVYWKALMSYMVALTPTYSINLMNFATLLLNSWTHYTSGAGLIRGERRDDSIPPLLCRWHLSQISSFVCPEADGRGGTLWCTTSTYPALVWGDRQQPSLARVNIQLEMPLKFEFLC